jgi:TPP-dependent 2-oxoacid decarboxylase
MIDRRMTVGRYLVHPLEQLSLKHVSGARGDYMLRFLDLIEESDMDLVNMCSGLRARAVSGIGMFLIK